MSDDSKSNPVEVEDNPTETKNDSNGSSESSMPKLSEEEERTLANRIAGSTRFVATVPAVGLLAASVVMAVGTIASLVFTSYAFVIGEISLHELTIGCIEYADSFLLAVALYILSIGLVSLFVSENIPLPAWLEFHDFDDLKERLTSVIIVMIGVSFLGYVLKGPQGIDILWLGLGCAVIIAALSAFMQAIFKSRK